MALGSYDNSAPGRGEFSRPASLEALTHHSDVHQSWIDFLAGELELVRHLVGRKPCSIDRRAEQPEEQDAARRDQDLAGKGRYSANVAPERLRTHLDTLQLLTSLVDRSKFTDSSQCRRLSTGLFPEIFRKAGESSAKKVQANQIDLLDRVQKK